MEQFRVVEEEAMTQAVWKEVRVGKCSYFGVEFEARRYFSLQSPKRMVRFLNCHALKWSNVVLSFQSKILCKTLISLNVKWQFSWKRSCKWVNSWSELTGIVKYKFAWFPHSTRETIRRRRRQNWICCWKGLDSFIVSNQDLNGSLL